MRTLRTIAASALGLALVGAVWGCETERTVSNKESVTVKRDGTKISERETVKKRSDGTVVKETVKDVDR